MARPKSSSGLKAPSYRLHKRSGKAVVTIDGRDIYLGAWGATREVAPESWQKYDRLIAEWLLRGRQSIGDDKQSVTVEQIIAGYLDHVQQETGGAPESGGKQVMAFRWLRQLYGDTRASDFSPMALKAMRVKMAQTKVARFGKHAGNTLCRRYINHMVGYIKRVFAWATEVELIPPSVHYALHAVKPLRRGQAGAHDNDAVKPIDQKHVDAVLEVAHPTLAAMIKVQLYTGARCGEVFQMRGCDIDMSNPRVWRYRPQNHKTQHHGKERIIFVGPLAQEAIRPFLKTDVRAYIFTPAEGGMIRIQCRRLSDGKLHIYRQPLAGPMLRKHRAKYGRDSYACAIKKAIARADRIAHERNPDVAADVPIVQRWHSHQLRHSAATFLRKEFGLEVAQAVLGHSSATMTEIYAEMDYTAAENAMAKVG